MNKFLKQNRLILTGVIESILFSAIIFIVFFVVPANREAFLTFNIQPLLLITAMIALRYGNFVGLFCAIVSSVLYLLAYYILGKDLFIFFTEFSNYKFILMFFLTAVILGHYRDAFKIKVDTLRSDNTLLTKSVLNLKAAYEEEKKIKEQLSKQIIGSRDSILSLYDIAKRLEVIDEKQLYEAIPDIFLRFLGVEQLSVYKVSKDSDSLTVIMRSPASQSKDDRLFLSEEMDLSTMIQTRRSYKNVQGKDSRFIMSAPVICNDEVVAIVNVEQLDFEMVTEYTFNLFQIIVDWLGIAIARARLVSGVMCVKDLDQIMQVSE